MRFDDDVIRRIKDSKIYDKKLEEIIEIEKCVLLASKNQRMHI